MTIFDIPESERRLSPLPGSIPDLEKKVVEAAIAWRTDIFAEPSPLSGQKAYASYTELLGAIDAFLKAREQ